MSAAISAPPSDTAPHLLVIDDDSRIRTLLSRYLAENGFRVSVAADAAEARRHLESLVFDLLIVDVMMPGESGIDFTRTVRGRGQVPILMLTALAETERRIEGLESGADDYLSKPFDPRELLLRVNNILKRRAAPSDRLIEQIRFGPFLFNIETMELRRDGLPVPLTDRERRMLRVFAEQAGETIDRNALLLGEGPASERAVDVQINRLRRKIEADPADPAYLQTVRGIGYRLIVEG